MTTATLDRFLGEVAKIVQSRDGNQLQQYLIIEPPLPPLYSQIVSELRQTFPEFNQAPLEEKCKNYISEYEEGDEGGSRLSFISFLVRYFVFLRDVDVDNLVETHELLKGLLNQSILALSSYIGVTVLPTVVSFSKILARLAIGLDKSPEIVAGLTQRGQSAGGDESTERITLVEGSANVIREAFKKCLSERSGPPSGIDSNGRPEGRRVGIYLTANLCLKLFFQCKKLRSAEQIFGNIYQQSPPLSLFPASQRVTFLYYLGRYLFANNHFFRAQLALQAAYDQCHRQCIGQKRSILIYLMTSNIILGRFPSKTLYQKPEAAGLEEKFQPVCMAITRGDLCSFRQYLDLDSEHADWFIRKRILLQLSNRCEVLVWRSLARRAFLLSGSTGDPRTRAAPTLRLDDLLILATHLEKRAILATSGSGGQVSSSSLPSQLRPTSAPTTGFTFGAPTTSTQSSLFSTPKTSSPLSQPPQSASDNSSNGIEDPPLPAPYICSDLLGASKETENGFHVDPNHEAAPDSQSTPAAAAPSTSNIINIEEKHNLPTLSTIESTAISLIDQDLIHGFLSHGQHRIAITGAKNAASPVAVGFPKVWEVLSGKKAEDREVPGWVREDNDKRNGGGAMMAAGTGGVFGGAGAGAGAGAGGRAFGGGMVVNLSGARPAGAAPG